MKRISILFFILFQFFYSSSAQFQNIRISKPTSTDPEEVTIAINPANPMNLAAGANIKYYYYSMDGGRTWNQGQLTSTYGVWGDPCVVFDSLGYLYFGHLSNPPFPGYWIDRIVVQRSTNGGQTWDGGVGVGFSSPKNQDKEWLAVDLTNSIYKNNIYMAWTEFDAYGSALPTDSSRILFSRSTDHGLSWSNPVRVSDVGGNCVDEDSTVEGAVPAVGPNGEVYLSWSGPLGIMFDKSTDGGINFGADIFVTSQPGGWDFGVSGIYRVNGMPVTACDVSNSSYRGNIYINWSDQRNGIDNTDIFFIKSTDAGQTWGTVKRVNDDITNRQQFFSWMTVDQSNGNIYIVFYDRRNTLGDATDIFVAKSTDGGETFINFKVSDSSFVPTSSIFFGDYTNIAAMNGKIYPIWMRLDSTKLSVWTAIVEEQQTITLQIDSSWNLLSVPLKISDNKVNTLFPTAVSKAFAYQSGYSIIDSLENGKGYWLKFPVGELNQISGATILMDTFNVNTGWNMIGSISLPVSISQITSDPPGMTSSNFYFYNGNDYSISDTIKPGCGYWVKTNQQGKLILSTAVPLQRSSIAIIPTSELPPSPPVQLGNILPTQFVLEQNYPNPFNPSTVIRYQLPERSWVRLKVYNLLGQEVMKLVDEMQDKGFKSVEFDSRNLQSGVYYYQLIAGSYTATKKMILIK